MLEIVGLSCIELGNKELFHSLLKSSYVLRPLSLEWRSMTMTVMTMMVMTMMVLMWIVKMMTIRRKGEGPLREVTDLTVETRKWWNYSRQKLNL